MGSSLFSKIVRGEIPCYKVAEDESHLAFLDIYPLKKGHTLVIPKKETDYIFDLPDEELSALHLFSKRVARAIESKISCKRIAVSVIGLEVPHVHIHLIPIDSMSDCNFSNPKLKLSQSDLEKTAEDIGRAFLQQV